MQGSDINSAIANLEFKCSLIFKQFKRHTPQLLVKQLDGQGHDIKQLGCGSCHFIRSPMAQEDSGLFILEDQNHVRSSRQFNKVPFRLSIRARGRECSTTKGAPTVLKG